MSDGLRGSKVVVTRAPHQAGELRALLESHGASVIEAPSIRVVPVSGTEKVAAVEKLAGLARGTYDALLVTSANTVAFLASTLGELGLTTDVLGGVPIFAVGPATSQALVSAGFPTPRVAGRAVGEGLVACVVEHFGPTLRDRTLLMPRGKAGRQLIVDALEARGARVDLAILYETVRGGDAVALPDDVDWVTFASPSAVRGFLERHRIPEGARVACIGPVTARAAREGGLDVDLVPSTHTLESMVRAMASHGR